MYSPEIKDKAKYKPVNTGFCTYVLCMRQVQLRDDNTCMRCGCPVASKEITYKATFDRLDKILEQITPAIHDHIFSEKEMDGLKIPIQIGTGNKDFFFVPLRYFVEFQNFKHTDDYQENKKSLVAFIEHIKKVSPKIKL